MTRVVCVLSGGGAKAAVHVGALRALEEQGLDVDHYVGTSMGAVIAAGFASGLSYDAMLRRVSRVTRRDVAVLTPRALLGPLGRSLFKVGPLAETIGRIVPARQFDELRVPLTITAVDAESGELVLFGASGRVDVPLLEALYASSALPVYYPPAEIDGRRYVDGGLRAVLPLGPASQLAADLVFAVYAGPAADAPPPSGRMGMLAAHDNALRIMMAVQAREQVRAWQGPARLVLVRPRVARRATFALHDALRYVEEGYRVAKRVLQAP